MLECSSRDTYEQTEAISSAILLFLRTCGRWVMNWKALKQQKFKKEEGVRARERNAR